MRPPFDRTTTDLQELGEGPVKVIHTPSEANSLYSGDVMVCKLNRMIQTYGEEGVRKAGGIITDS